MAKSSSYAFIDRDSARRLVRSFAGACGVSCQLADSSGSVLYQYFPQRDLCRLCRQTLPGGPRCESVHLRGSYQAEQLGGRYIYSCPMDMGWISSAVVFGGRTAASLAAGPIMMMEKEDYIASLPPAIAASAPGDKLLFMLDQFPYRTPEAVSHMSLQLLASACYLSDNSRLLMERRGKARQQQEIGNTLQKLKVSGVSLTYPREKESALLRVISSGDLLSAHRLLNELLGHIFFSSGGNFDVMRVRSLELLTLVSRAAMDGGANVEQLLLLNQQFLMESNYIHTSDGLSAWLARAIERYASLVLNIPSVRHRNMVYRGIHYMHQNLSNAVTLEETARIAGFSPSYFSRVFKREMGISFSSYLTRLRVEYSKTLLLSGDNTMEEVCTAAGFGDQSYFIRVFRNCTGVTPGKFRQRQGRLDPSRERVSAGE